jgi:hypothetical protein
MEQFDYDEWFDSWLVEMKNTRRLDRAEIKELLEYAKSLKGRDRGEILRLRKAVTATKRAKNSEISQLKLKARELVIEAAKHRKMAEKETAARKEAEVALRAANEALKQQVVVSEPPARPEVSVIRVDPNPNLAARVKELEQTVADIAFEFKRTREVLVARDRELLAKEFELRDLRVENERFRDIVGMKDSSIAQLVKAEARWKDYAKKEIELARKESWERSVLCRIGKWFERHGWTW